MPYAGGVALSVIVVVAAVGLVAWIAAHATLAASLVARGFWRAAIAFVVPPLAPWWGFRFGMPRRAWAWIVAIVVYAIGVIVARV
jgi:hypothetical protein